VIGCNNCCEVSDSVILLLLSTSLLQMSILFLRNSSTLGRELTCKRYSDDQVSVYSETNKKHTLLHYRECICNIELWEHMSDEPNLACISVS